VYTTKLAVAFRSFAKAPKKNGCFGALTSNRSSLYRQLERKFHVGENAFVIPFTYGHKNCCSVGLSVFFEVKDDNGNDDNDDSGNIIFIFIIDCQKSHTVLEEL
jgi:hypothetical protein